MKRIKVPAEVRDAIKAGALVVINHSGGKDSQAMFAVVSKLVPRDQILVVHAALGDVEWPGTEDHARKYTAERGFEFLTVQAADGKTLLTEALRRRKWPSAQFRSCTSDLKRDPIAKAVRGALKSRESKVVINCMGLRAQESCQRAKKVPLKLNARDSKAGRTVYDWLPILDFTLDDVLATVKEAGQKLHWAYALGMSRLSCSFCIMASKADLRIAREHRQALYKKYLAVEREIGHTMFTKKVGGVTVPVTLDEHLKEVA